MSPKENSDIFLKDIKRKGDSSTFLGETVQYNRRFTSTQVKGILFNVKSLFGRKNL